MVAALATLVALALPTTAGATVTPGAPPPAGIATGSDTDLILSGLSAGQGVSGFLADPSNPFDPVADGYPPADPTSGFTAEDEGFAGVIEGTPTSGGAPLELYCIDLRTETWLGIGYTLGTWNQANVANVGYVARLLNSYYPNTGEPAALTDLNRKAAAVQAAIWFFSDRYVLRTSDPLHDAVAAITAAVIAEGPLVEPPPPSLAVTPSSLSGPPGSVLGPYTVTSSVPAAVMAIGAQMFADASATVPVADGSSVPSGSQIWLRSTGPSAAVLSAVAKATVPSGNVYLYDGNSSATMTQRLILAQTATLQTTVRATAEFKAPGALVVTKTIGGPAAGQQGTVTISVSCNGQALPNFVIPPGTAAGTSSHTYGNLPAGSTCTVSEVQDGSTDTVSATVTGGDQQVTVPAGGAATAAVSDTYTLITGSLVVNKTITGPAAGQQGTVVIAVTCNGDALPDFVIPASAPAGTVSRQYDGIPAGTSCTITEPVSGTTSEVTVTTEGSGQVVTVPTAAVVEADVTDVYDLAPGSLVVRKLITGPAAGQQGQVTITTTCDGSVLSPPLVVPAGTPAGTTTQTYSGLAAGTVCTVTESADGSLSGVADSIVGSGQEVTIPAGQTVTANLIDNYQAGSLVVNKTITGPAAGQQGDVVIDVTCNGTPLPPFVIRAGTGAGTVPQPYPNILAGSVCTVEETTDGASGSVTASVSGSPQNVTIAADGSGEADITDTYTQAPGSLVVSKTIAGPAAGQQGDVRITTTCNGQALPDIVIGAGAGQGTTTRTYPGLQAGAACTVAEVADGSSSTVLADVTGRVQTVVIPPGGTAPADLADSYQPVPGSLVVAKTISGSGAGQQGAITVATTCNGTALPAFVIPAGSPAGTFVQFYDGIAPGSSCTVTETDDGATGTVYVEVHGSGQSVTVPGATVVPVSLTDDVRPARGILAMTKTLAGPAAGQQGPVSIVVDCGGPLNIFAFDIPAARAAGTVPGSYDQLPAGSPCAATEATDGATASVSVVEQGSGHTVTVPPGGTAVDGLTDTFVPATVAAAAASAPAGPVTAGRYLASTGADRSAQRILDVGLAALAAGLALTAASRRRRRAKGQPPGP